MANSTHTLTSPFILGVCGPTGSGKSTLAGMIASRPNFGLIQEPIPEELLHAFAVSPNQFGLALQNEIISAKLRALRELRSIETVVLDRTIQEDREVFFNLHNALGYLTRTQLIDLCNLAEEIEASIGKPHALVYLTADPETLRDRMARDGRPRWLIETLTLQLELYENFEKRLATPFLRIDTTELELNDLVALASWIQKTMMRAFKGLQSSYEKLDISWRL